MVTSPLTKSATIRIGRRSYEMSSDDAYLDRLGLEFEPTSVALFETLVTEGDTVLDVGANIGCTTLLFAQRADAVYSFEPSPRTFAFLAQNVRSSGCHNVVLENIALGGDDAVARLVSAPSDRSGSFISALGVPGGYSEEEVAIKRGDAVVEHHDIGCVDFIKIDTEGYELDVLEGLRSTIERDRPLVCLELNHWCLNAFRRMSVPDFLDQLRSVFPVLYAVDANEVRDLHDEDDTYFVLHEHIVGMRFRDIVAAFDATRLDAFLDRFVRRSADLRELEDRCRAQEDELARLEASVARLSLALEEAQAGRAAVEVELADTRRTISWRLTRPLRAVRRWTS